MRPDITLLRGIEPTLLPVVDEKCDEWALLEVWDRWEL
jgi:hypothetical protein